MRDGMKEDCTTKEQLALRLHVSAEEEISLAREGQRLYWPGGVRLLYLQTPLSLPGSRDFQQLAELPLRVDQMFPFATDGRIEGVGMAKAVAEQPRTTQPNKGGGC